MRQLAGMRIENRHGVRQTCWEGHCSKCGLCLLEFKDNLPEDVKLITGWCFSSVALRSHFRMRKPRDFGDLAVRIWEASSHFRIDSNTKKWFTLEMGRIGSGASREEAEPRFFCKAERIISADASADCRIWPEFEGTDVSIVRDRGKKLFLHSVMASTCGPHRERPTYQL